ncbi:MAG: hypothetical protein HZC42_10910 [Candidatus Eisenbacteria bacterium]|nr:hypothetical protein [Candidatus Eisenbacteria bacterium]
MDPHSPGPPPAAHAVGALYGLGALLLATLAWSGLAVLAEPAALPAAAGMGWLVGWAYRYGAGRVDRAGEALAALLSVVAVLSGSFLLVSFAVTQASVDVGAWSEPVRREYLRLFVEAPWFGAFSLLLALAGTGRALRLPRPRNPAATLAAEPERQRTRSSAL